MDSETSSELHESLGECETDTDDNQLIVEEDELDIFHRDTHYVTGTLKKNNAPVLAAITPIVCGWRCRSIYSDTLRHDYVNYETIDQVETWLARDIKRGLYLTTDREGIVEHLANLLVDPVVLNRPALVVGPPLMFQDVAAEAVLQHLEHGY